ncbi:methyl-accepting chemotaxis protein [Ferrimonas marina]|uniref:Methyl-accepting chemotaxis sensory transducer with Cache sensor n=1 Tax=Ferrimonas marina TaxID=299255 RepID=A0A1M5VTJ6_9GAMM|nr:methyl-accepting chemotaxis protein [Ferrimonas marina]SHH78510.1 methyl-accepting chemotaxis sensory transducer with Cache sensor [Ferrimonas marina]
MTLSSLSHKVALAIALLCSSAVALVLVLSYNNDKRLLQQRLDQQVQVLAQQQTRQIADWLQSHQDRLAAVSLDANAVASLQQAEASGDFAAVYFGGRDGQVLDSDPSVDWGDTDPRQRPWYQLAWQQQQAIVTEPYTDIGYGTQVVTLAQPVATGVVAGDLPLERLASSLQAIDLPAKGQLLLVQGNRIIGSDQNQWQDRPLSERLRLNGSALVAGMQSVQDGDNQGYWLWASPVANSDWHLLVMLDEASVMAPLNDSTKVKIPAIALFLGLVLTVLVLCIRHLLKPLQQVSHALKAIAEGNGDLTQRIELKQNDEIGRLAQDFNRFLEVQHGLIQQIRSVSGEVSSDARHALERSSRSAAVMQSQQGELSQLATAITQMTAATEEIARNAEQTAAAAQQSATSSQQGQAVVSESGQTVQRLAGEIEQATTVINQLKAHTQAISGILATIQGIAEQTNLLALNAAIEAARAGEQGRGFAVVADEVRLLSQRTQQSTEEIQATIETLQSTTSEAVAQMDASRELAHSSVADTEAANLALGEITQAVNAISDMATQIATAVEEQTQVAGEIHHNTRRMADSGQSLATEAQQGESEAQQLQDKADQLTQRVSAFRL